MEAGLTQPLFKEGWLEKRCQREAGFHRWWVVVGISTYGSNSSLCHLLQYFSTPLDEARVTPTDPWRLTRMDAEYFPDFVWDSVEGDVDPEFAGLMWRPKLSASSQGTERTVMSPSSLALGAIRLGKGASVIHPIPPSTCFGLTIGDRRWEFRAESEDSAAEWARVMALSVSTERPSKVISEKERTATTHFDKDSFGQNRSNVSKASFFRYEVIGRGMRARFLRAIERQSGEFRVIKEIDIRRMNLEGDVSSFLEEVPKHARIFNGTRFLPNVHAVFSDKKKICVVFDFVEGGELLDRLQKLGHFTIAATRRVIAEIVLAIEYLHSYGITYQCLRPDNILLTSEGGVVLTDYGLVESRARSSYVSFVYTPEYEAPELITLGEAATTTQDWWCVGVLLFEFLSGSTPFYSDNIGEMYERIFNGSESFDNPVFASEEGRMARDLIAKLLLRDPKKRLGSTQGAPELKRHPFFSGTNWVELKEGSGGCRVREDECERIRYWLGRHGSLLSRGERTLRIPVISLFCTQ